MFRPSACAHWYRCLPLKNTAGSHFIKKVFFLLLESSDDDLLQFLCFLEKTRLRPWVSEGVDMMLHTNIHCLSLASFLPKHIVNREEECCKVEFLFWNKLKCCRAQTPAFLHRQSPAVTLFFSFNPHVFLFFFRYSLLLYTRCNGATCQSLISTCKVTVFFVRRHNDINIFTMYACMMRCCKFC